MHQFTCRVAPNTRLGSKTLIFDVFSAPALRAAPWILLNVAWWPLRGHNPIRSKFLKCRPLRGQKILKCRPLRGRKSLSVDMSRFGT